MAPYESLGGLELRVLLATLQLRGNAYTTTLVNELEERTGREVAPAAIYIALRRLEKRGLIASELRKRQDEGGMWSRRYFRATRAGVSLVERTRDELSSLWSGLELRPAGE